VARRQRDGGFYLDHEPLFVSALEAEEYWRFRCPTCTVECITKFPVGYRGHQVYNCPGCGQLAEVVERPKIDTEPEGNVVDMYARRAVQLVAETLSTGPKEES
jgi:predicted RNA-binding Zn-ribbon protein involved in translation (DUF1610 family)